MSYQKSRFVAYPRDVVSRTVILKRPSGDTPLIIDVSREAIEDFLRVNSLTPAELCKGAERAWPRIRQAAVSAIGNGAGVRDRRVLITSRMLEAAG